MLWLIVGLILGTLIGFMLASLLTMSKIATLTEDAERYRRQRDRWRKILEKITRPRKGDER